MVTQSELGRLDMEWVAKLRAKSEKESAWLLAHRLREDGFCAYWGEYNADRRCQVLARRLRISGCSVEATGVGGDNGIDHNQS